MWSKFIERCSATSMNFMKQSVRISGKLDSQIFAVSFINRTLYVKWKWVFINYHPKSNAAANQNLLSSLSFGSLLS